MHISQFPRSWSESDEQAPPASILMGPICEMWVTWVLLHLSWETPAWVARGSPSGGIYDLRACDHMWPIYICPPSHTHHIHTPHPYTPPTPNAPHPHVPPSATTQIARDRILGRHPFWVTVLSMYRTHPKKIYVFEMRNPPRQLFLRLGILIDNSSLSAIRRSLWFCDWHIIEVPKGLPVSLS